MEEKEKRGRGRPKGVIGVGLVNGKHDQPIVKTGGRQKGTPRKTDEIKNRIRLFLNANFEKAVETWKKIECPKQKFDAYVSIMPYVYPKMRSIEVSDVREKSSIEEKLEEIANSALSVLDEKPN